MNLPWILSLCLFATGSFTVPARAAVATDAELAAALFKLDGDPILRRWRVDHRVRGAGFALLLGGTAYAIPLTIVAKLTRSPAGLAPGLTAAAFAVGGLILIKGSRAALAIRGRRAFVGRGDPVTNDNLYSFFALPLEEQYAIARRRADVREMVIALSGLSRE